MKKIIMFFVAFVLMASFIFMGCEKEDVFTKMGAIQTEIISSPSLDGNVDMTKSVSCQCLPYIRNCTGLPANPNSVSAKNYGQVLSQNAYYSTTGTGTPKKDDVVIFNSGFGGGINATHGHIGFITDAQKIGTGTSAYWQIKIKSANWTNSNIYTQCSCSNVENSNWIIINTTIRKNNITYWRK